VIAESLTRPDAVAAKIPGVISLGTVADHGGRSGIALAYDGHGVRSELILDPATSALLGETDTAIGPGASAPAGAVLDWAVHLDSEIVGSLPAGPPADRMVPVSAAQTGARRRHRARRLPRHRGLTAGDGAGGGGRPGARLHPNAARALIRTPRASMRAPCVGW
jgi:hypothetical protein